MICDKLKNSTMDTNPPAFTPRDSWPPGTVVKDDYVIESRLGKGGFGTVYKAKHRYLQSEHVIKRLHEEYSSDEEYVRKFIAEGQAIRRLKECPYIVAVEHMTLTSDQYLILIMEFMPGGDLNSLMQERRHFTIAEVAGYTVQIAEGLRAAHAIELIHRDIKPHNVLLAENKRKAKLADFGIAADHKSVQATSVVRGGSLGYAAPEQWTTSGRNLDGRTDIYALGVTMYQMLTQVMPYAVADIGGWIDAVRTTTPVHVNRLREDVPEDINRLVMQMIEVRREHRPADIESVLASLRPYADAADWSRSGNLHVPPDRTLAMISQEMAASTHSAPPPPPPPLSPAGPPTYTPTEYQRAPTYSPPPQQHPQPYTAQPPSYAPPQQPPAYTPQPPNYPQQQMPQPGMVQPPTHWPQQQSHLGPPPPYMQPPQQPVYPPQPPPQQQTWGPPPQPPQRKKGGSGKWFAIVPIVLALAGGGGWFGWKQFGPDSKKDGGGGTGTGGGTDDTGAKMDWVKKGEEARDRKDYHEAVKCFRRQPSGVAHIQSVQVLVEADVEAKVAKLSDGGHFDQADALVSEWLADFPNSERLQAQKELIRRRREAQ